MPELPDYDTIYQTRFLPEVVFWADDMPRDIQIDDYGPSRMFAQQQGLMVERIIMLDDLPIGTITARDYIERTHQCTLGVVIADPKYWGHGYGTIAVRLFLKILYATGVKLVVLETYANNKRAQKCFLSLGFVKRRVYFAAGSGRFVVEMINLLPKNVDRFSSDKQNRNLL